MIMFEKALRRIRKQVRLRQYLMTYHARKEMNEDELTLYEVERTLLTGKVLERQKDPVTSERKYRIRGETLDGLEVEVIVKIGWTGKVVIITVYVV